MLLLLTLTALERGGAQTALADLAREVERAGADVDPPVTVEFRERAERLAFADGLDLPCAWGVLEHTSGSHESYARSEQREDEALLEDLGDAERTYLVGQRARIESAVADAIGYEVERRAEAGGLRPLPLAARFREPALRSGDAGMSPGANRWRPRRAGIINLYEYANQVFDFAGGRLLLRGHNTSGKTKALDLLLPFCLDGDIRPTKLDPFASGAKPAQSSSRRRSPRTMQGLPRCGSAGRRSTQSSRRSHMSTRSQPPSTRYASRR